MNLCKHHEDTLQFALEVRGCVDRANVARHAIGLHATNFAGSASLQMLKTQACPLCFINANNPARQTFNDWIELAADEARTSPLPSTLVVA